MMMEPKVVSELSKLANDLYSEGYHCGISGPDSDKWFKAWATAMQKVAAGEKYADDMVIKCFEEIQNGKMAT